MGRDYHHSVTAVAPVPSSVRGDILETGGVRQREHGEELLALGTVLQLARRAGKAGSEHGTASQHYSAPCSLCRRKVSVYEIPPKTTETPIRSV